LGRHDISIIGSGVVGTATGKGFHKLGHNVIFFDISKQRLATLKLEGYDVASSLKDAISRSEICFVCVNTPLTKYDNVIDSDSNNPDDDLFDEDLGKHQDLSQLQSVLRDIVRELNGEIIKKRRFLVFRSTMLPGTMRNVVLDYLEANCDQKCGKDYEVLYNPEFLRQHSALEDFLSPDRIVIGQELVGPSSPLSEIYNPLTKNIIITGYEEAEMVKYASNCFLAMKISYFNEIGILCKKMGINEEQVGLAVSMDNRIGRYGTRGGRPFGGACFPKDTEAFASFVRKMNVDHDLIEKAISINKQMEELTSANVYLKERRPKDQYIKEPEI